MATRWPGWVYDHGEEPDARFSFANERTFLSWIQTSLGLLAAGVALQALPVAIEPVPRRLVSILFVVLSMASAVIGGWRWARSERALRRKEPLPGSLATAVLVAGVVLAALILLVLISTS